MGAWLRASAADQVAEGRLVVGRFTDGMGRPEPSYILYPAIARRLRGLVGKTIRVSGQPFGAHTVHHHAPIVLRVTKVGRL